MVGRQFITLSGHDPYHFLPRRSYMCALLSPRTRSQKKLLIHQKQSNFFYPLWRGVANLPVRNRVMGRSEFKEQEW